MDFDDVAPVRRPRKLYTTEPEQPSGPTLAGIHDRIAQLTKDFADLKAVEVLKGQREATTLGIARLNTAFEQYESIAKVWDQYEMQRAEKG